MQLLKAINTIKNIIKNITINIDQRNNFYKKKLDVIDPKIISITSKLKRSGFESYIVGGFIRDSLLNKSPKDCDIVTNATPEEIHKLFKNSRIIGRRFKLVHLYLKKREIIEIATFRANHNKDLDPQNNLFATNTKTGRILRDNVFGDILTDSKRRDFTINAFYYDPLNKKLIDLNDGLKDFKLKEINLIGNPELRYKEDPVRMIRAIRFSTKLNFAIGKSTAKPISNLNTLLNEVPSSRLYDEMLKLFLSESCEKSFDLLKHFKLFPILFPNTAKALIATTNKNQLIINLVLKNTRIRLEKNQSITPAFIFAALLWPVVYHRLSSINYTKKNFNYILQDIINTVINEQNKITSIPKKVSFYIKSILELQYKFNNRYGKKAELISSHQYFRAAFDFLLIREQAGFETNNLGAWWEQYQNSSHSQKQELINLLPKKIITKKYKSKNSKKTS